MCFKQDEATFNDQILKLVGNFTSIDCDISSTESDVNMRIGNSWTTIDKLCVEVPVV